MAEVLRAGDSLQVGYADSARSVDDLLLPGSLFDLGSNRFTWGIVSASCPNSTHVDITFGGPVAHLGSLASDPSSYQITPSLAVVSASVISSTQVQLQTARMVDGIPYMVQMVSVQYHGTPPPS